MTTPPHYVPVNEYVYAAALSGCVAGAMGSQPVTSVRDETYGDTADNAIAFAEEFDTLWDGASLDVVQYEAILDSCTSYWRGRLPQSSVPSEYEGICAALITMVNEADAAAIAAGATPPPWPPSGGGGSFAPLSRTLFVDGGSVAVGAPNGSIANPYLTIEAALTAIGAPTGTTDASNLYTVVVTPCVGGYNPAGGMLVIPANRSVCLTSTAFGPTPGTGSLYITANVTWTNSAAIPKPTLAIFAIIGLVVIGNVTIADAGAGSPTSIFMFNGLVGGLTEFGPFGTPGISGTLSTAGASELLEVLLSDCAVIGAINTAGQLWMSNVEADGGIGTTTAPSKFYAGNTYLRGAVTLAGIGRLQDCELVTTSFTGAAGDAINFDDCIIQGPLDIPTGTTFSGCRWTAASAVSSPDVEPTITFDSTSYNSLLSQGGSFASVTPVVQGAPASASLSGVEFLVAQPGNTVSLTPALSPGTPLAAFNLTCTQTGRVRLIGEILVNPGGADTIEFDVQLQTGSASAGYAPTDAVNTLLGSDSSPLTVPGGGTVVGRFQESTLAINAERSMTIAVTANMTRGTPMCLVIYASSTVGTYAWTVLCNLSADEA